MASAGHPKLGPADNLMVGGGGGGGGFGGGRLGSANSSIGAIGNAGRAVGSYVSAVHGYKSAMNAGVGKQGTGGGFQRGEINALKGSYNNEIGKLAQQYVKNNPNYTDYLQKTFPKDIPGSQQMADKIMGKSDWKKNMDDFNRNLKQNETTQNLNKSDWINQNKNWLADQQIKDLGKDAKKAAGDAGKALAKDAAAVASTTAATALTATDALGNELIDPDTTIIGPTDPSCPGCRDKRPDRKRKRNKDYPPKDKDDDEEEEDKEEEEKEEDNNETDDSGSSCEDGYEGESDSDAESGGARLAPVIW
jgi:hypothetical protein